MPKKSPSPALIKKICDGDMLHSIWKPPGFQAASLLSKNISLAGCADQAGLYTIGARGYQLNVLHKPLHVWSPDPAYLQFHWS